jgi:hypothetical protein
MQDLWYLLSASRATWANTKPRQHGGGVEMIGMTVFTVVYGTGLFSIIYFAVRLAIRHERRNFS